ncbi:MAG: class I SAM-dependent methyltransferase [Candidatus Omnitrophota bacterium]
MNIAEKVKWFLPSSFKKFIRQALFAPLDIFESIFKRDGELRPPRWAIGGNYGSGSGNFKDSGRRLLSHLVDLGGLAPGDAVLDVGCGIGRLAIPLTGYLTKNGRYEGFDVIGYNIKWCSRHISARYPNFRFTHSDVYNKFYNRTGRYKARDYVFPYQSDSFDMVFLLSVFTHMLPEDMEHYVSEISRVTKRSGRCFVTFFLLNPESIDLMNKGKAGHTFRRTGNDIYRVDDKDIQESIIAYDENFVKELFARHGFITQSPIHYGSWCGRKDSADKMDILIFTKG